MIGISEAVAKFFGIFNPGGAGSEVIKDLAISPEEKDKRDRRKLKIRIGKWLRERISSNSD